VIQQDDLTQPAVQQALHEPPQRVNDQQTVIPFQ
jgi:hypothetical protein